VTVPLKRVTVPSAVGENRRRIQILEAVAASSGGGSGIQFGGASPTYGDDNVGEWLMVETTDFLGQNFSVTPNGMYYDPTGNFSAGMFFKYGLLITGSPSDYHGEPALSIIQYNQVDTGGAVALRLDASAKPSGSGIVQTLQINGTSYTSAISGIGLGVITDSATATGVTAAATAGATGTSVGGKFTAKSNAGSPIGLRVVSGSASGNPSGTVRVIEGYYHDNTGDHIVFRVDSNGDIHIKTGGNVIADL
jgi:hypothetical protein